MKAAPETNEPYDDALFLFSHILNTVRMRANSRETTTYVVLGEFLSVVSLAQLVHYDGTLLSHKNY
jgi:hypothetical protein